MSSGRAMARKIALGATQDIGTRDRRRTTYARLQQEATARPGAVRVDTSWDPVWMSPNEHRLYEAMGEEGLAPVPQHCVQEYYADIAFPDVGLAVEADGAAYYEGDRRQADRTRDWIRRRAGWTVKRFHGSTIQRRARNCRYVPSDKGLTAVFRGQSR